MASNQTVGESRVRVEFNPSNSDRVHQIKQQTAELINICENMKASVGGAEKNRCCSIAQTKFEEAAMWAVKAATAS